MAKPSKLDALREMREAHFTGRKQPRATEVSVLRKAITEEAMTPRKSKRAAKRKTKPEVHLSPTEHELCLFLAEPRSRPEINAQFEWSDHTSRSTLSRLNAKIGTVTKKKTDGVNYYRVNSGRN